MLKRLVTILTLVIIMPTNSSFASDDYFTPIDNWHDCMWNTIPVFLDDDESFGCAVCIAANWCNLYEDPFYPIHDCSLLCGSER